MHGKYGQAASQVCFRGDLGFLPASQRRAVYRRVAAIASMRIPEWVHPPDDTPPNKALQPTVPLGGVWGCARARPAEPRLNARSFGGRAWGCGAKTSRTRPSAHEE